MERRAFLGLAVKAGGTVAAGAALLPAIGTVLAPAWQRRGAGEWVDVGAMEGFARGGVSPAVVQVPREDWAESLRARGVFVWLEENGEAVVFARACTDLGCPVTWDPGSGWYFCPCHGGIFDREGVPRSGPPRRPLYRYASRVENGILQIDLNSVPPLA